jgi:hypothetical protein
MSTLTVTGRVVFNHVTEPDRFENAPFKADPQYSITLALDSAGIEVAKTAGLKVSTHKDSEKIPEGETQLLAKRKEEFGQPKVYNSEKQEAGANHLSLFGDTVAVELDINKTGAHYLGKRLRVEEKAVDGGDYDPADF